MSWLFSQALVAEYSAAICSDGAPSAPSNGTHTQQAYLSHGKTTAFSRLSRFGMTCKPLTDAHGEALLTSYLAAFRARTSALQGGGKGIEGERSGMWKHMARIVGEVLPRFVFVENSPLLVGRGLAVVLGDLADLGYDAQWFRLSASDCEAPHQRDRLWIVAHSNGDRNNGRRECGRGIQSIYESTTPVWGNDDIPTSGCREAMAYTDGQRQQEQHAAALSNQPRQHSRRSASGWGNSRWPTEPDVGRVADGVAARVDRLKAIGNGQVPRVAAAAFAMLAGK